MPTLIKTKKFNSTTQKSNHANKQTIYAEIFFGDVDAFERRSHIAFWLPSFFRGCSQLHFKN